MGHGADARRLRIVEPGISAAVDARIEREAGKYLRGDGGKLIAGLPVRHATHLLAGIAKCAVCGGGMEAFVRFGDKSRTKTYGCASHRRKGATVCPNREVIAVEIADREILRVVEKAITADRLAAIVNRAAELHAGQADQTAALTAERMALDKAIRNLTAGIAAGGDLDSLVMALKDKEQRRQAVERELQARSTPFDLARLKKSLTAHAAGWRGMLKRQTEGAKQILQKLVAERFIFTPEGWPERRVFLQGRRRSRVATSSGVPSGIRTRVLALKGPRPGPLDDGDSRVALYVSGQHRNT